MPEAADQPNMPLRINKPAKRPTILGDVSSQLVVQLAMRFIMGVSGILLARHLSNSDYGLLGTAIAFAGFANYFTDMGFNPVLVREAAAADFERRRKLIWTSVRSRLVLTALVTTISFIAVGFISRDPNLVALVRALLILTAVSGMLINWVEGAMAGTEQIVTAGYLRFLHACAQSAATLAIVLINGSLTQYVIFQGVANWLIVIVSLIWVLRHFPYTSVMDRSVLSGIGAFSAAGVYFVFANQMLPYAIISNFMSDEKIGWYRAGATLAVVLYAIPGGIANAMYTRLCRAWQEDREEHTRLAIRSLWIGSVICGLIGVGLSVGSAGVIQILFSNKFPEQTIFTLSWVGIVPLLQSLSLPLGDAMASSSQFKTRTWLLFGYVIGGSVLCYFLPLRWGVEGTAVAGVAMEVLLVGLYLSFTRPKLRNQAVTVIGTQSLLVIGSILIGVLLRIPLEPWLGRTAGSLSAALIAAGLYGGLILVINAEIKQFVVHWMGKVLGR